MHISKLSVTYTVQLHHSNYSTHPPKINNIAPAISKLNFSYQNKNVSSLASSKAKLQLSVVAD